MKKIVSIIILFFFFLEYNGQISKEEILSDINTTGGVYYAYPTSNIELSKVPKDYTPFYISHYGRHGSRWLISENDFLSVLKVLRSASDNQALTENGINALKKLEKIWKLAEGHNGDLTELGAKQQEEISRRMIKNNFQAFEGKSFVTAKSTVVPRCIISMAYFTKELIANNPNINLAIESSDKYMKYLNHHTKESIDFRNGDSFWQEEKRKFRQDNMQPDRFVNNLFNNKNYIYKNINPEKLMEGFYWIASDMQNINTDISFYDLFTKDELFNIYQSINYQTYVNDGPSPLSKGIVKKNAIPLVKNILNEAEYYVDNKIRGAARRVGRDGNIIPLVALLKIEGMDNEEINPKEVFKVWNTFQAAPMAANLQLIFYKNKKNNVVVKILHNEREVKIPLDTNNFPYYEWKDVKSYLERIISE